MDDAERAWVDTLLDLVIEIRRARDRAEMRHCVRLLEFACHARRTRDWGEPGDVVAALLAAPEETS